MPVTVGVNFMSVVHQGSGGVTVGYPDMCTTPAPPSPPVPVPYPNVARSGDATRTAKKVKVDGHPLCTRRSCFSTSTGDEAGTLGGVASGTTRGQAQFVGYAMDVMANGQPIPRALDLMLHNDKNSPPTPLIQGPVLELPSNEPPRCSICDKPL
ncbi:MAG: DUF4150 domain-containing protein [Myxococcota bacterium]